MNEKVYIRILCHSQKNFLLSHFQYFAVFYTIFLVLSFICHFLTQIFIDNLVIFCEKVNFSFNFYCSVINVIQQLYRATLAMSFCRVPNAH